MTIHVKSGVIDIAVSVQISNNKFVKFVMLQVLSVHIDTKGLMFEILQHQTQCPLRIL